MRRAGGPRARGGGPAWAAAPVRVFLGVLPSASASLSFLKRGRPHWHFGEASVGPLLLEKSLEVTSSSPHPELFSLPLGPPPVSQLRPARSRCLTCGRLTPPRPRPPPPPPAPVRSIIEFAEKPKGAALEAMKVDTTVLGERPFFFCYTFSRRPLAL